MSEKNNEELIEAQKEVIGILFEVIKRFQANNELDEEYFRLITNENKRNADKKRLDEILQNRKENGKIITRLLKKLEI